MRLLSQQLPQPNSFLIVRVFAHMPAASAAAGSPTFMALYSHHILHKTFLLDNVDSTSCLCAFHVATLVCRSQHHLVVVGAQECNYTKDARMSRRRSDRQERTFSMTMASDGGAAAAAEAGAAAAPPDAGADTGMQPPQQQQQQ
jgi:hypothetical protein